MDETPEPIAGLIRDHRLIEEVVSAAHKSISAAAGRPREADTVTAAMEELRDLQAFSAIDLTVHIAKEEEVLFPAIKLVAQMEVDTIIGDMLAQHDEVRDRNAEVQKVLDAIDSHHDEVTAETSKVADGLRAADDAPDGELPGPEVLNSLFDTVKKLDWILQGHFLDEEDNLFEPALAWFDASALAELAGRMALIDARYA